MTVLKLARNANSVGLINCLLQPGLFYLRIQRSMREEFNSLIKYCTTRTDPAAETKSIGLQADALVVMVFASPIRQFYHDGTNPAHLSGLFHQDSSIWTRKLSSIYQDLVPSRQFIVKRNLSSINRDWQKTRHRDADGT